MAAHPLQILALFMFIAFGNCALGQTSGLPLAREREAVRDAGRKFDKANSRMLLIRQKVEAVVHARPEFVTQKQAMDGAKSELEALERKIIARLENVPAYAAQKATRDRTRPMYDAFLATDPAAIYGNADIAKLSSQELEKAFFEYTTAVAAMEGMEKDAQEKEPGYAELKEKLAAARTTLDAMQVQVEEAMKPEPDYPAAAMALADARIALKQARETLEAAIKNRRVQSEELMEWNDRKRRRTAAENRKF